MAAGRADDPVDCPAGPEHPADAAWYLANYNVFYALGRLRGGAGAAQPGTSSKASSARIPLARPAPPPTRL